MAAESQRQISPVEYCGEKEVKSLVDGSKLKDLSLTLDHKFIPPAAPRWAAVLPVVQKPGY